MTKHPNENQLQSFIDREGDPESLESIRSHLSSCETCAQKAETMRTISARVRGRLDKAETAQPAWTTREARRKLNLLIERRDMEDRSMWNRMIRKPAAIALAVALVFAISLAFPQVRAMGTAFLKIFRVQQVAVVPVDMASMPDSFEQKSEQIEALISDNAQYETSGERTVVQDAAEASDLAGFTVRLPSDVEGEQNLLVEPAVTGTFTLDVERINLLLKEMDQEDLSLSEELDNAVIEINIPHSVASSYGSCEISQPSDFDPDAEPKLPVDTVGADCLTFLQIPSPTVQAPDGLDLDQLGKAFFEMTGMSAAQAQTLSEKIDWSSTLVIPIPSQEAQVSDVQVDGVTGTLIENISSDPQTEFALVWVKEGILYCVSGNQDSQRGIDLANSLQ